MPPSHSDVELAPGAHNRCIDLSIRLPDAEVLCTALLRISAHHHRVQVARHLCANNTAPFAVLLRTSSLHKMAPIHVRATQQLNKSSFLHLHMLWPTAGHLLPLHLRMQDGHVTTAQVAPVTCLPAAPKNPMPAPAPPPAPWMLLAAAALAGTVCGVALTHSTRHARVACTPTNSRQRINFLSSATSIKRNLSSKFRRAAQSSPPSSSSSSPPLSLVSLGSLASLGSRAMQRPDTRRKSLWDRDREGRLVRLIEE